MSRFYVSPDFINGRDVLIDSKEAHHILNVLRLKVGDKVYIFDGTGKEYKGTIHLASRKGCKIIIDEIIRDKSNINKIVQVTLAQAIPKRTRMDFIIEKSTELGVDEIIPMITDRSIVRTHNTTFKGKLQRWTNIAISASKQCGRLRFPRLLEIQEFRTLLKKTDFYNLRLMACLSRDTTELSSVIQGFRKGKVLVMIGPEGDFTDEEIKIAKDYGAIPISLGDNILRSDTAGIYVLSVLKYLFKL